MKNTRTVFRPRSFRLCAAVFIAVTIFSAVVLLTGCSDVYDDKGIIPSLDKFLSSQSPNTKDTPYSFALNIGENDFEKLGNTFIRHPNKYVSLDLSGSTITTIPNNVTIGANVSLKLNEKFYDGVFEDTSGSFNNGFETAYNNNGRQAGTYTRPNANSSTWTKQ